MKLHDLRPADGSRTPRTRVGRGIAAGKGKTAGRGTKGQKARAGGSIQPWFEGGQTPLHMRIPKLRGFKNRFKIEYEVVNVGRIGEAATLGAFDAGDAPGAGKTAKAVPATVNQEILRAVGLVRRVDRPMKILGHGDIDVALFVVADSFSKSARAKIETAGGSVQVLEMPKEPLVALGVEPTAAPGRPAKPAPQPKETEVDVQSAAEPAAAPAEPAADGLVVTETAAVAEEIESTPDAPAGTADPSTGTAEAPAADASGAKATRTPQAAAQRPAKAKTARVARPKAKAADEGSDGDAPVVDETAAAPATDDNPAAEDA
jgi:large subunit ribosomal protein L15